MREQVLPFYRRLRFQLSGYILLGALLIGVAIVSVVLNTLQSSLKNSLVDQGKIIGMNVAELAAEKLIEEDLIALRRLIEKYSHYPNVEYILVEDFNHQIRADTYNGNVPPELVRSTGPLGQAGSQSVVREVRFSLRDDFREAYDVQIPIKEGLLGFVRVGLKKSFVQKNVGQTLFNTAIILTIGTGLTIILVLAFITLQITRPVLILTEAARRISLGEFDTPIHVGVKNELAILAESVERMRESLRTSLLKLKARPVNRF